MHVLVTGSEGRIGLWQTRRLREAGHEVRTLDRRASATDPAHIPGDLRDIVTARAAVQGVEAVVHLGALPFDGPFAAEDVYAINVLGTLNLLVACVEAGVKRFVYYSSVQALGNFQGFRESRYLPIDDAYPRHPMSPYQVSKHLGEEACRAYTDRYHIATISLRPVWVVDPDWYVRFGAYDPAGDRHRTRFDYWAYVDVRDVVEAGLLAVENTTIENDAFLLTADDTCVTNPTAELVDTYYSSTPWKQDRESYLAGQPNRSLVDCTHAKQVLGWQPKYSWRGNK